MATPTEYIVLALTGTIFIAFVGWLIFIAIWVLGKFGLWRRLKFWSLKRQFGKDYDFKEDIIEWCGQAFRKKWRYKDVKRFVKYEKDGKETLYTYMLLAKLKPEERQILIERGYEEEDG